MIEESKEEAIRKLSQSHPYFGEFFRTLSLRQRNQSSTDIDVLVKKDNDNMGTESELERRKLAIEFFRGLEKIGVGKFKIGRRGRSTRFVWQDSMLDVVKLGVPNENGGIQNELNEKLELQENSDNLPLDAAIKLKKLTHRYILRENYEVILDLPADLTEVEAERLSAFIKTLPIIKN